MNDISSTGITENDEELGINGILGQPPGEDVGSNYANGAVSSCIESIAQVGGTGREESAT